MLFQHLKTLTVVFMCNKISYCLQFIPHNPPPHQMHISAGEIKIRVISFILFSNKSVYNSNKCCLDPSQSDHTLSGLFFPLLCLCRPTSHWWDTTEDIFYSPFKHCSMFHVLHRWCYLYRVLVSS